MSDREPSSANLIISLGVAGLVSGLVLVGIFLVTLPVIQNNQAEALKGAILRVLPGTDKAEAMSIKDGKLALDPAREGKPPAPGEVIYRGRDKAGAVVGYAVPANGNGFMDNVSLIYGFDHKRQVIVGMEVLESRETPGLGDKIILDQHFLSNFKALAVDPTIVPVKNGAKAKPNEVDCITGATISSKAVVSILNNSMGIWKANIGPGAAAADPKAGGPAQAQVPSAGVGASHE